MKRLFVTVIFFLSVTVLVNAQVSYTIDSTSMNIVQLDGGNSEIEFADINQDGHIDALSIGDHGSAVYGYEHGIMVFFGNGTGSGWTLFQSGNFGYGGIAVGDINNDGLQDVAYSMHHDYSATDFGDQLIEAALGDGTGMNWTPWDDSLATNGENYGQFGTDLGDIDNDGLLDIGSLSFGCCSGLHIYRNKGNGEWHQTFGFVNNGNTLHYIQFGDINHDGNLDFAVCHQNGTPYFGNGAGGFTLHHNNLPSPGGLSFRDISLDDIDNDGDDDLAFVTSIGSAYVYKWNDVTQAWVNSSTGISGGSNYCARLADLDMDGFSDLVTVSSGQIKIWTGNGGTSWTNSLTYAIPNMSDCTDITFGDVDDNGFPDILLIGEFPNGTFNVRNKYRLLKENSVPAALNISMSYPKGFECFPNNAVRFIRWVSAVPNHNPSSVSIELSSTGTSGPWTVLAAAAPNNGKFQWTVPSSITSINCFFRLIVTDSITSITDTIINSNPFQIGVCFPNLSGVQDVKNRPEVIVAPNPFHLSANVISDWKNCSISILDLAGETVHSFNRINFPFMLQRNGLASGMYVLEIRAADGRIERQKLMIN